MKRGVRYALLGLVVAALFFPQACRSQFMMMENEMIGARAPDFRLETLEHGKISLSDQINGKNGIVFFWATWCPHCREALKGLNAKKEELAQKGIEVILVGTGESESVIERYAARNGVRYDVFVDQDSYVAEEYGVIGLPTFFFVDKEGVIRDVLHQLPPDYEEIFAG